MTMGDRASSKNEPEGKDMIRVLVTKGQREILETAAERAGLALSTWIRWAALRMR